MCGTPGGALLVWPLTPWFFAGVWGSHPAEDAVATVEMRGGHGGDEELAVVCVCARA